jgi:selenocysteine lyase/cysteine desulfurase
MVSLSYSLRSIIESDDLTGSFGGIPNFVEDSCQDLSRSIESNADGFIRHHLCRRIDSARAAVAKMVGAETDTCVFVPNVATGINTVLKNFDWKSGDVLVHSGFFIAINRDHRIETASDCYS